MSMYDVYFLHYYDYYYCCYSIYVLPETNIHSCQVIWLVIFKKSQSIFILSNYRMSIKKMKHFNSNLYRICVENLLYIVDFSSLTFQNTWAKRQQKQQQKRMKGKKQQILMSQLRFALIYSTENQCCNRLNKYIRLNFTAQILVQTAVAKIIIIIIIVSILLL